MTARRKLDIIGSVQPRQLLIGLTSIDAYQHTIDCLR
jgi:hypothetical protein